MIACECEGRKDPGKDNNMRYISELMRAAIQQEPGNLELLQEVSLCQGWCCSLDPAVQCNIELYLILLVETDQ